MGLVNLYKKLKLNKLIGRAVENPELLKNSNYWIQIFQTLYGVKEIRVMLQGYKTYIVAALSAAVTVAHMLGYIDDATFQSLTALLGAGAVGTVAAKINRVNNQIK